MAYIISVAVVVTLLYSWQFPSHCAMHSYKAELIIIVR
jgi:hypothetical protein